MRRALLVRAVAALLLSAALLSWVSYTLIVQQEVREYEGEEVVKLDVPFVRQKDWFCSEASASMVLRYYGFDLSQEEINAMGYERYEEMLPLLSEYLNVERGSLSLAEVREELDEGDPVMIRVKRGMYRHTMVIVGYGEGFFYVHDPAVGPYWKMRSADLLSQWWYTNYDGMKLSKRA